MNQIVQINGCPLIVRDHKGQRVVTTADVANLHKVSDNVIRQNFKRNRRHFVEGEDYFIIIGTQTGSDNLSLPKTYFTESGYLMLVKSLRDDLAWEIQRALVNGYFKAGNLEKLLAMMGEDIRKLVRYRGMGLTQRETGKLLDMSKDRVGEIEARLKEIGYVAPDLNGTRFKKKVTGSTWRFR